MKKISMILIVVLATILFGAVGKYNSYEANRTEINRGIALADVSSYKGLLTVSTADTTTITDADTTNYLLNAEFSLDALSSGFAGDSTGILIYTGAETATKNLILDGNLTIDKASTVSYVIYKNGVATTISKDYNIAGAGTINAYMDRLISVSENDTLQVYLKSNADTTQVITNRLDIIAK